MVYTTVVKSCVRWAASSLLYLYPYPPQEVPDLAVKVSFLAIGMPRLPTSNAPANKEELAELLKNDTKIKVCGKPTLLAGVTAFVRTLPLFDGLS